ncbi:MAG: SBBP repeat-containing protein [Candidatus Marinimicrobia bacterium]|nr:SBBP repeat-containing protein [Candidatus Neomarinimicrobiota bacterium]
MRLRPSITAFLFIPFLLFSNGIRATHQTENRLDLFSAHTTLGTGFSRHNRHGIKADQYQGVEKTIGITSENRETFSWGFAEILTDSVDFGWVREYGSNSMPSTDQISGITSDGAGNVYVTGSSDFDWLTLKYDPSGTLVWSQTYTEPGIIDTYGEEILVDGTGNIFVAGYRWGPYIDSDILLVKYDQEGVQQWVAEYSGVGLNNDFPTTLALDPAGNIFIGGYTYGPTLESDYLTLKYDQSGNLLWDNQFNGSAWNDDWITDMATDDMGNVYVTGITKSEDTGDDYAILKYDANGVNVWTTLFDGIVGTDWSTGIAVDTAGQVYISGVSQYYDDYIDYYTLKLDTAGSEVWGIRYGVAGDGDSWASDIAVDSSLNVTVTGVSFADPSGFDYVTIQYDSTGELSWLTRYSSTLNYGYDEATSLILDGQGYVIVTGVTQSSDGTDDIVTVKYDSSGSALWETQYAGGETVDDIALHLAVDGNDAVIVGGSAITDTSLENYAIIKYQSDGTNAWNSEYDGPGNSSNIGSVIATDSQSNVFVAGIEISPETGADLTLMKYDTSGLMEWVLAFNGAADGDDVPLDIITDNDGNVIVTGFSEGTDTDRDILTMKYSSDGDQLWLATYDGPRSYDDEGSAIAVDPVGNIYVTGHSSGNFTNYDFTTIKYDVFGNEVWVARYVGPNYGSDAAEDIVLDADGNVYVTGYSYRMGTNLDFATVKYDILGSEEWVARYNGPVNLNDYANAIGLDAAGNVYVTGSSIGSELTDDFTTIKYSPTGVESWVAIYDGSAGHNDQAYDLNVNRQGQVVVSGSSYSPVGGKDFTTIWYNSSGVELWESSFDGAGHGDDQFQAMTRDGTGATYVTGRSLSALGSYDFTTLKYDQFGEVVWTEEYSGSGYSWDDPADLVVDFRGTLWVTGTSHYFMLGDYDWSNVLTLQYLQPQYPVSVSPTLPEAFKLNQNYPNPFNPRTILSFDIPEQSSVRLAVYDILGKEIALLIDGELAPGRYTLNWEGLNQEGHVVAAGVYFCRLNTGGFSQSMKMLYLK